MSQQSLARAAGSLTGVRRCRRVGRRLNRRRLLRGQPLSRASSLVLWYVSPGHSELRERRVGEARIPDRVGGASGAPGAPRSFQRE